MFSSIDSFVSDVGHQLNPIIYIQCLLFGGLVLVLSACNQKEPQTLTEKLDYMIAHKANYEKKKENRIQELKQQLNITDLSLRQEYVIDSALCQLYMKYKVDSAIHYAERNIEIVNKLNDKRAQNNLYFQLIQVYSLCGMNVEAIQVLNKIESSKLPKDLLVPYYTACKQYYTYYNVIINQDRYANKVTLYNDSILMYDESSSFWHQIRIVNKIQDKHMDEALSITDKLQNSIEKNSPEYAQLTFQISQIYRRKMDVEMEKKYCILSAMADIMNATKENASFIRLAEIYYENGDLSKASLYAQSAIEDALFSKMQFRTIQMSKFYSIINLSHKEKEEKAKANLQLSLGFISVLSVVLVFLLLFVYKQFRKLSKVREELLQSNLKLKQFNEVLNGKNVELSDSNFVKEQYIAQFFDLCSTYINKMDDYRKSLKKLTQNRQFDELYHRLTSTSMVEEELGDLYKNFDVVFLNLYPTFVTDFNSLLVEEERIVLKPGELLNRELRIFALLRMGIDDGSKIASFLHCSISTVYNYKTKVRNKSIVSKAEFDRRVLCIGNTGHSEQ